MNPFGILHLPNLEVRLYSDRVEFYRGGAHMLTMTPQEYGETMRWMETTLRGIASWPWQ